LEQDEIIAELIEENKTLKKLLEPISTTAFEVQASNLDQLIKEGVTAIRARKVESKVEELKQLDLS